MKKCAFFLDSFYELILTSSCANDEKNEERKQSTSFLLPRGVKRAQAEKGGCDV